MTPNTHTRLLRTFASSLPEIRSMGMCLFDPIWAQKDHLSNCIELYYVVKGHVEVIDKIRRFKAGPGDIVLNPTRSKHRDVFDLSEGLEVFMVFFTWKAEAAFFNLVDHRVLRQLPKPVKTDISSVFERLRTDTQGVSQVDQLLARTRIATILCLLVREAMQVSGQLADTEDFGVRRRKQLMLQAKIYLEEHFQEPVALDQIANTLGISSFYLSRVFSRESNFSLMTYLTSLRMNKARTMLEQGEMNVSEVAYAVGYEDPNYFSKVFRKFFGAPPRDFLSQSK